MTRPAIRPKYHSNEKKWNTRNNTTPSHRYAHNHHITFVASALCGRRAGVTTRRALLGVVCVVYVVRNGCKTRVAVTTLTARARRDYARLCAMRATANDVCPPSGRLWCGTRRDNHFEIMSIMWRDAGFALCCGSHTDTDAHNA